MFRTALLALPLALCLAAPAFAAAPLLRLALTEPEIEGDLSDPAQREAWPRRLELIDSALREGVAELYEVADPEPAEDLYAQQRRRRGVHACEPCAKRLAERLDADRVLSVWVFRMSKLVLSMHAVLRDGDTGAVRYARTLSFRSDNDRSWKKAVDYLLRDMANEIPPESR